jgi:acetyl-CoA carboxylase biotin carboxyl carrier protein
VEPAVTPEKNASPRPFDVKTVEYLISLMAQHELSEISLIEGEQKIRLRKGGAAVAYAPAPAAFTPAPAPAAGPSAQAAPAEPAKPAKNLHEIKSPMVGTFYAKPSPDKPDFVSVGSKVTPATVVCKLEAMKIFNDLTADISGTIAEVCVKNAQPVDYNTVLFRVELS